MSKIKILYYDLESTPLKAYLWQLGKQVVRHNQLDKNYSQWGIICITYCWNDGKPAQCIDWGYEEQDTGRVIGEFDEIIKQADFTIGKNSDRFDTKMINAARMFAGLPGMPAWTKYTEDLEKQMRRYFRLPSQSLDYISSQLGLGGKIKMEFQDWIDIVEKTPNGKKALAKMIKYGKKDVVDTRKLWNQLQSHFDTRINMATIKNEKHVCKKCGSANIKKNGTRSLSGSRWQEFYCNDCCCYAGRAPISKVDERIGRVV